MTDRHDDFIEADVEAKQTVANDAVAGETVLPGPGDGNDGPTGGMPRSGSAVPERRDGRRASCCGSGNR